MYKMNCDSISVVRYMRFLLPFGIKIIRESPKCAYLVLASTLETLGAVWVGNFCSTAESVKSPRAVVLHFTRWIPGAVGMEIQFLSVFGISLRGGK